MKAYLALGGLAIAVLWVALAHSADASLALQLPWPTGSQHRINSGGQSYGCGVTHGGAGYESNYYAIDFEFSTGQSVSAIASGTVSIASLGFNGGAGNYIAVDHGGGHASRYLHLDDITPWPSGIGVGTSVSRGQLIAYSGDTGGVDPHLHFDLKHNGAAELPEPMSGVTGFGNYGLCTAVTSPLWTSQPPPCNVPFPPYDGTAMQEQHGSAIYLVQRNTKFVFHSLADFNAMGYTSGSINFVCVPDGFMSNFFPDMPPDKTTLQEYCACATPIYVMDCQAKFGIPDYATYLMITDLANGYASQLYPIPPGEMAKFGTSPTPWCHMKEVSTTSEYIVCAGQKWGIPNPYVRDRMGLGGATLRVLWDGALSQFPTFSGGTVGPSICPNADGDDFSDFNEIYVGTLVYTRCAVTTTANDENPDPSPPDFNDSGGINVTDVLEYQGQTPQSVPPGSPRLDLNADSLLSVSDVLYFKGKSPSLCQ